MSLQNQDTASNLYDFPAREYGIQGRWPSPDPAGIGAANLTDPQTWNRYGYVRNTPLIMTDPTGMDGLDYYLALQNGDNELMNGGLYGPSAGIGGLSDLDLQNWVTAKNEAMCPGGGCIQKLGPDGQWYKVTGTPGGPCPSGSAGSICSSTVLIAFPNPSVITSWTNVLVGYAGGGQPWLPSQRFSQGNQGNGSNYYQPNEKPTLEPEDPWPTQPAPTIDELRPIGLQRQTLIETIGEWLGGLAKGVSDFIICLTCNQLGPNGG